MNKLYKSVGASKQSFHQYLDRYLYQKSEQSQLLQLIYQIRENHPTMGIRDMYYKLLPSTMGRDKFEAFCKIEGLMSDRPKNWARTTDSSGVIRFDNLIANLTIDTINMVWQSDITYYELNSRFYYITFIIDSFTRVIVGHATSNRLTTDKTTLPALNKAINSRIKLKQSIDNLIFHSDGGGQYYAKSFLKITGKYNIRNSMCEFAWENGKAERINGVIKNNYLKHRNISTFEDLIKEVDRSVYLYNNDKPHIKLQRKTPIEFENDYICNGQKTDDEKSATELKKQSVRLNSLTGRGQKTSDSKIAQ